MIAVVKNVEKCNIFSHLLNALLFDFKALSRTPERNVCISFYYLLVLFIYHSRPLFLGPRHFFFFFAIIVQHRMNHNFVVIFHRNKVPIFKNFLCFP